MASYADTRRITLQYQMSQLMNMPEFKRKPSAVINMLLSNGQTLIGSKERAKIDAIKVTDSDTVEVNILDKQSISTGTARAYDHSGSINDSTSAELSFITRNANFKYSIKQADRDGVFSLEEMIAKQMLSAIHAIHDNLETYYLAWLNTNKSQVANTSYGS